MMSAEPRDASSQRRPSPWYLFHLAIAMAGIAFLVFGFGGELRIRAGLDAFQALNHEGLAAFVFALSLGYLFRLIFWRRIPSPYQALVRNLLSLILCAEIALAVVTIFLLTTQGNVQPVGGESSSIVVVVFTSLGTLCQISTVIWLLRYRRE